MRDDDLRTAFADYDERGFALLPGFVAADDLARVRRRIDELVDAFEPDDRSGFFSTRDPARAADDWFLGSDHTVRCFLEEGATDALGRLTCPKAQAINKIGHALHDLDPVFDAFSHGSALAAVGAAAGLAEPQVWQSQVICKPPGIGGEVRWHQDATYFFSDPVTVTTFWFALEDADTGNGCLWVEPGGHRGPLRERFHRDGDRTWLERLDATPWPDAAAAVPLPCAAGTLVVFHGLLPHWSGANRSPRSRRAYTLHVTDGRSAYARSNWIQRDVTLPVRGLR